jgi:hypothetical protein
MRELIYLSRRKLASFYPGSISRSVQFTGGLGLGPVSAKINISAPPSEANEETTALNRAVRYMEREAVHFSHSELSLGRWIFFDLNMGYGTSYRDSGSPPKIDDIALFHGSLSQVETDKQSPLDLLLCGSTEHLRIRTASAGRMGSGTEWLYDVIREIEEIDALGTGELPDSLNPKALAVRRVNMPEEVARWVFDVIRNHHAPTQYTRLQGFARILFIVPATEYSARLVLATPLFVQFASSKPVGIRMRRRMQRELSRRHGHLWRKWQPRLPPEDRGKVYIPLAEREGRGSR